MTAFLTFLAAFGWAAAAFLAGWRFGERSLAQRADPRRKTAPGTRSTSPPGTPQAPAPVLQQDAARRAVQAWQNFLRYDGSAQDGS